VVLLRFQFSANGGWREAWAGVGAIVEFAFEFELEMVTHWSWLQRRRQRSLLGPAHGATICWWAGQLQHDQIGGGMREDSRWRLLVRQCPLASPSLAAGKWEKERLPSDSVVASAVSLHRRRFPVQPLGSAQLANWPTGSSCCYCCCRRRRRRRCDRHATQPFSTSTRRLYIESLAC